MVTLKEGKILDHWATMLEQCHGHDEELLRKVEKHLEAFQAPGVSWKRESVSPGWLKGLRGKRRDFLLLTHAQFGDYLMCVGARDYGTTLDVSWHLLASGKRAVMAALATSSSAGAIAAGVWAKLTRRALDVFDQQDLTAYVTIGHRAVLHAVDDLMGEQHLDASRLERKSRGVFGVS
jgi:hypothetical protein